MIKRKYISMLIGATFTSMINTLVTISDSFVCGIFLGDDAVSAVNATAPIYNFFIFLAMLLTLGIPIMYSKEMGLFNTKEAGRVFGTGMTVSIFGGIFIFLMMTVFEGMYD